MQSWPEFQYPAALIVSAAASMSASSKMMTGALPPSSRWTRLRLSAAARATFLPDSTEPVIDTIRTRGCDEMAAPTGSP